MDVLMGLSDKKWDLAKSNPLLTCSLARSFAWYVLTLSFKCMSGERCATQRLPPMASSFYIFTPISRHPLRDITMRAPPFPPTWYGRRNPATSRSTTRNATSYTANNNRGIASCFVTIIC
jgi:hypothetical protein